MATETKATQTITTAPVTIDQGSQDTAAVVAVGSPTTASTAAAAIPAMKTAAVVKSTAPAGPTDFESFLTSSAERGDANTRILIGTMRDYVKAMDPKRPITGVDGDRMQRKLLTAIKSTVENITGEQFKRHWRILLAFFYEYRSTVFHMTAINRFAADWSDSDQNLKALQNITNILLLTANPSERAQGLRSVKLSKALEIGFSEEGRQRVIGFYGNL